MCWSLLWFAQPSIPSTNVATTCVAWTSLHAWGHVDRQLFSTSYVKSYLSHPKIGKVRRLADVAASRGPIYLDAEKNHTFPANSIYWSWFCQPQLAISISVNNRPSHAFDLIAIAISFAITVSIVFAFAIAATVVYSATPFSWVFNVPSPPLSPP